VRDTWKRWNGEYLCTSKTPRVPFSRPSLPSTSSIANPRVLLSTPPHQSKQPTFHASPSSSISKLHHHYIQRPLSSPSSSPPRPPYLVSTPPALQATILHFPGNGPTISLLLSSLNVGFLNMNVHTYTKTLISSRRERGWGEGMGMYFVAESVSGEMTFC
jgi:hypothetical protein